MFGRIRASIAGEPQTPEKSHPSSPAPPQSQERGFFGGLLHQGASPNPSVNKTLNSVEASPGTIRKSAAALLQLATPPLTDHPEINPHALNDGIDDVDLAQRDTLEHQINRRDAYISKLQHDLHKMQNQLNQHQKDNNTLRRQQLESTHRHSIAIKLWRRTNDGLRARVECFENETTPAAAREIANLIRDAAPPNKDSAYLMMLQDQLTKATAKLDHLGSQTEIVLHKGEEVVESLREEMNEVIRERCRMELELLDQERMLEDDMRRMVLKTERRLNRVQGEIDFLEKNAVECLKSQEDEEGDDEGDENEEGEGNVEKKNGGKVVENADKNDGEGETDDGSTGGDSSEDNGKVNKPEDEEGSSTSASPKDGPTGKQSKEEHTPEILRKELRTIAMERDRSLSVLQKKLREKNEEFHKMLRLKQTQEKTINKLEAEKKDRMEWERSRQEMLLP